MCQIKFYKVFLRMKHSFNPVCKIRIPFTSGKYILNKGITANVAAITSSQFWHPIRAFILYAASLYSEFSFRRVKQKAKVFRSAQSFNRALEKHNTTLEWIKCQAFGIRGPFSLFFSHMHFLIFNRPVFSLFLLITAIPL